MRVRVLLLRRRRNIGTHPKLPIALLKIALYRRDQMLPELLEVSTRLLFTRRLPPHPGVCIPNPKLAFIFAMACAVYCANAHSGVMFGIGEASPYSLTHAAFNRDMNEPSERLR